MFEKKFKIFLLLIIGITIFYFGFDYGRESYNNLKIANDNLESYSNENYDKYSSLPNHVKGKISESITVTSGTYIVGSVNSIPPGNYIFTIYNNENATISVGTEKLEFCTSSSECISQSEVIHLKAGDTVTIEGPIVITDTELGGI